MPPRTLCARKPAAFMNLAASNDRTPVLYNSTYSLVESNSSMSLTTLTATVGMVWTQGSAGVGRTDIEPYSPIGFSPIFGTWEVDAFNNHVDLSFSASGSAPTTLDTPIIVVHNYTGIASSAQVLLDGTRLTANSDYFMSQRPGESEL